MSTEAGAYLGLRYSPYIMFDCVATYWDIRVGGDTPDGFEPSLHRFFFEGLGAPEVCWAIELAVSHPYLPHEAIWRYACGICWHMIRDEEPEPDEEPEL